MKLQIEHRHHTGTTLGGTGKALEHRAYHESLQPSHPENHWGNDWVSCNDGILKGLRQNLRTPGFHQLILYGRHAAAFRRMVLREKIWHQIPA